MRQTLFRAGKRGDDDLDAIARRSRKDPGRFNTSEFGAIYVALEETTALHELHRTTEEAGDSILDAQPCVILLVEATINQCLDLTTPAALTRCGLTQSDVESDDLSACQRVAARAVEQGMEAIVWESAARSGGRSMAIFAERLGEGSSVAIAGSRDVDPACLHEIAADNQRD